MTLKRFTWNSKDVMIDDTVTGNQLEVIDITEIDVLLEVLNELYEENQSSKEFIEQLQKELILFKKAGADMGNDLNAQITTLKQENKQLKQQINAFKPIIFEDTNNGSSSILYEKVD